MKERLLKGSLIFLGLFPSALLPSGRRALLDTWSLLLLLNTLFLILQRSLIILQGLSSGEFSRDPAGPTVNIALGGIQIFVHACLLSFRLLLLGGRGPLTLCVSRALSIIRSLQGNVPSGLEEWTWNELFGLFLFLLDLGQRLALFVLFSFPVPSMPFQKPEYEKRGLLPTALAFADTFLTNLGVVDVLGFLTSAVVKYLENGVKVVTKNLAEVGEEPEVRLLDFPSHNLFSSSLSLYSDLHLLLESLRFYLGFDCFMTFFLLTVTITFDLFFALTSAVDLGTNSPLFIGFLLRVLIGLGKLVIATNALHRLGVQRERMLLLVTKVFFGQLRQRQRGTSFPGGKGKLGVGERRSLLKLKDAAERGKRLEIHALGFFSIGRETLTSIIAVISNYLVVLLQFQMSSSN